MKKEVIFESIKSGNIISDVIHKIFIKNSYAKLKEKQHLGYNKLYKKYKNYILEYKTPKSNKKESNYVWICWLQGEDNAPALVKSCINSARKYLKGKKIVVITNDNLKDYVQFPSYIDEKFKSGKIGFAHYSDLIRIELICKYGGLWIDSTVLCTSSTALTMLDNKDFLVFKELDLSRSYAQPIVASNWFIYSKYNNNPILSLTKDLLFKYWEDNDKALDYYFFHFFFTMATKKYSREWENVPTFNNHSPHVLMFELNKVYSEERWNEILMMSPFHKLQRHIDYSKVENSMYVHILDEFGGNYDKNIKKNKMH